MDVEGGMEGGGSGGGVGSEGFERRSVGDKMRRGTVVWLRSITVSYSKRQKAHPQLVSFSLTSCG